MGKIADWRFSSGIETSVVDKHTSIYNGSEGKSQSQKIKEMVKKLAEDPAVEEVGVTFGWYTLEVCAIQLW